MPTAKSCSIHLTTVGVEHFKVTIIITTTIISHVKFKQLLSLEPKILCVRHTSLGRVYLKLTERSCEVIAEVLRVDRFLANQIFIAYNSKYFTHYHPYYHRHQNVLLKHTL
jgi:hypothetical protein